MIAFDLNCGNGHPFEGWFSSAADFATQKANGMLVCPLCADVHVHKALSVPNVPRKGNQRAMRPPAVVAPLRKARPQHWLNWCKNLRAHKPKCWITRSGWAATLPRPPVQSITAKSRTALFTVKQAPARQKP